MWFFIMLLFISCILVGVLIFMCGSLVFLK